MQSEIHSYWGCIDGQTVSMNRLCKLRNSIVYGLVKRFDETIDDQIVEFAQTICMHRLTIYIAP